MRRHLSAKRLRTEHSRDAGKPEGDAENVAARQRLTARNGGDDQRLYRDGGNPDRTPRSSRMLQRRAEGPRKEAEEQGAKQRDCDNVGSRNARLRPDERQCW